MKAKIESCKDPEMDPNSRMMERALPGINKRLKHVVDSVSETKVDVTGCVENVGEHVLCMMDETAKEVEEVKEDVKEVREDIKVSFFFLFLIFFRF